jgi:hypothetical protein
MLGKLPAFLAATLAALMLLAGCGGGDDDGPAADSTTHTAEHDETTTAEGTTTAGGGSGGRAITVQVVELNGSGQNGTATLTEVAGGTRVLLELRGGRPGPQSADIRKGTCEQPARRAALRLQNLTGGRSETHVEAPLATLISADYVILVQRSTTGTAPAACGYLAAL